MTKKAKKKAKLVWRIDWHEGDGRFEGCEFTSYEVLSTTLRAIGSEESLRRGGYNKVGVTLLVDGKEVWSERLDQNVYTGENDRPYSCWEHYRTFYRSERGRDWAKRVKVDPDARVAYYDDLLAKNWKAALAYVQSLERSGR